MSKTSLFSFTIARNCINKGNPATLQWETVHQWTSQHLYEHLTKGGHPVAIGLYQANSRRKEAFITSHLIGLDFDYLSVPMANELLSHPFVTQFAAFTYSTPSHTKETPRLRLFFLLEKPIDKAQDYESAVRRLMSLFQPYQPDRACKDAARFFFGNNQPDFAYTVFLDNRLPLEEIEYLVDPEQLPSLEQNHDLPQKFLAELNQAIRFTGETHGEFLVCHCPIHPPDNKPSAHWHPDKHFLYCFHESRHYLAKEVGQTLGLTMYDHDIHRQTNGFVPSVNNEQALEALSLDSEFPKLDPDKVASYMSMNEYGDALLLMWLMSDRILFEHAETNWYWWEGNWWAKDRLRKTPNLLFAPLGELYANAAKEFTKRLASLEASEHSSDKQKAKLQSIIQDLDKRHNALRTHTRSRNVLNIASSLHSLSGMEWDRNPLLLGVQNGVVDLSTGELRRGVLNDYIRKVASVDYTPHTLAPRWNQFILEIVNGDYECAVFLQRLFGYAITGLRHDHVLPVFYGRGRNGKDTLVETIGDVLGDYASAGTSDLLIEQAAFHGQAQPHIYNLMGKRLVWITETSEGSRLNVNQVKYLTGTNRLSARPLYGNPIEFEASHHILLFTNHKPRVPSMTEDYAIWKRLLLIPLALSFVDNPSAPHERLVDPLLKDKLKAESQGILNWLIQGCLDWQKQGLNPPDSIRNATNDYARSEDVIGLFLDECCLAIPHKETSASELKAAFTHWATENGYPIVDNRKFSERLLMDFEKRRTAKHFVYIGVTLKA